MNMQQMEMKSILHLQVNLFIDINALNYNTATINGEQENMQDNEYEAK